MRTEEQMLDLIIRTAQEDSRIRAAFLEGSRVNPAVPKDIFQDYDVGYIVTETASFRRDPSFIERFGTILYMQYPEDFTGVTEQERQQSYGWLMQFTDGVRMDLTVHTKEEGLKDLEIFRVLVDKDGIMPPTKDRSDRVYWIRRPSRQRFSEVANEFWWCQNNIAKGLWRDERPYALDMLDTVVRPQLRTMLEWKIAAQHQFSVSAGKKGKYFKRYLSPSDYGRYLSTWSSGASLEGLWKADIDMAEFFREKEEEVAGLLGYDWNRQEAQASLSYLLHVRDLPKDAAEVYAGS